MRIKVFTLIFDDDRLGFDAEEMERFLELREVVEVREHFFTQGSRPVWAVMVTYLDLPEKQWPKHEAAAERAEHKQLDVQSRQLFEVLRQWRNKRAREEGKPAYTILNNNQLAGVARARPETMAALERLEGIGKTRLSSFGEEILAVLKGAMGRLEPGAAPAAPEAAAGDPEASEGVTAEVATAAAPQRGPHE